MTGEDGGGSGAHGGSTVRFLARIASSIRRLAASEANSIGGSTGTMGVKVP